MDQGPKKLRLEQSQMSLISGNNHPLGPWLPFLLPNPSVVWKLEAKSLTAGGCRVVYSPQFPHLTCVCISLPRFISPRTQGNTVRMGQCIVYARDRIQLLQPPLLSFLLARVGHKVTQRLTFELLHNPTTLSRAELTY